MSKTSPILITSWKCVFLTLKIPKTYKNFPEKDKTAYGQAILCLLRCQIGCDNNMNNNINFLCRKTCSTPRLTWTGDWCFRVGSSYQAQVVTCCQPQCTRKFNEKFTKSMPRGDTRQPSLGWHQRCRCCVAETIRLIK